MFRLLTALLVLCLLWRTATLRAQEGVLARVRDEVKNGGGAEAEKEKPKDQRDSDDGEFCGQLGWMIIAAPFMGPRELLADDGNADGYFPTHPYAQGQPGYMWLRRPRVEDGEPPPEPDFARARGWSGRAAVEESNDFDGINRASLRLLLETGSRFGIQTNWSHVHEQLGCGGSDKTVLGDLNVTYLFAWHECAQCRAGLGARMITDRHTTDFGFNFTYGVDVFPCKPWVISATFDAGTLGKAGVFRGQGSVGVLWRRWEIYGGYDYLRIGSTALQGPTIGIRLWF